MPKRTEWITVLARANSTSISLRATVPKAVVEALAVETASSLVWRLATIAGSVCAIVYGEA